MKIYPSSSYYNKCHTLIKFKVRTSFSFLTDLKLIVFKIFSKERGSDKGEHREGENTTNHVLIFFVFT